MSKLAILKKEFRRGNIPKAAYIKKMHVQHKALFEYSHFIASTDICKIEITDNRVLMTSRQSGIRIICDEFDRRISPIEVLNFDAYEPEETNMMLRLIKKGDTIFDIGANVGWYTLNLRALVKDSTVYAFEPIPKTYAYLQENIKQNNLNHIHTFNIALSHKRGTAQFYYNPTGLGNASATNLTPSSEVKKVTCKMETLDNFVKKRKIKVDFIKCDVEGAELFVFQGALQMLAKDNPVIFTEMLRKWSKKFNYHPNDIISLLKKIGYKCFYLSRGKLRKITSVTEKTVPTNFFFLHEKKHASLIRITT